MVTDLQKYMALKSTIEERDRLAAENARLREAAENLVEAAQDALDQAERVRIEEYDGIRTASAWKRFNRQKSAVIRMRAALEGK